MPAERAENYLLRSAGSKLSALLARLGSAVRARRRPKSLRLREMLPLGDKRFLAVVECDQQRFLLAGTAQHIALLERLPAQAGRDAITEGSDR